MDLPPDAARISREEALDWAILQAQGILHEEFDREPLGVFKAAERMEWVLTFHPWTDRNFPLEISPFVTGWTPRDRRPTLRSGPARPR